MHNGLAIIAGPIIAVLRPTLVVTQVKVYFNICNLSPCKHVFQPLIVGHQMVIGCHYTIVNGDRHDGLQVSCNSVRTIYEAVLSYNYHV